MTAIVPMLFSFSSGCLNGTFEACVSGPLENAARIASATYELESIHPGSDPGTLETNIVVDVTLTQSMTASNDAIEATFCWD